MSTAAGSFTRIRRPENLASSVTGVFRTLPIPDKKTTYISSDTNQLMNFILLPTEEVEIGKGLFLVFDDSVMMIVFFGRCNMATYVRRFLRIIKFFICLLEVSRGWNI